MSQHIIYFMESVNDETCKALMNQCLAAIDSGVTEIQLRMSSSGGFTSAGFWLANVIKSLPVKITTHNMGEVNSIAIPVFLAASERSSEPSGRFVIHPLTWTVPGAGAIPHHTLREWVASLDNDVDRYVGIFEDATRQTRKNFNIRAAFTGNEPSVLDPPAARRYGVIQKVVSLRTNVSDGGRRDA